MWSLLPRKARLSLVIGATLLIAWTVNAAQTYVTGRPVSLLKLASPIATFLGVGLTTVFGLTWRWWWRKVPALGRLVFPDLNGRWDGALQSDWKDPATGQKNDPIAATMRIRQGLLDTVITMITAESTSLSTSAVLEPRRQAGCYRIRWIYDNDPQVAVKVRSRRHEGVAFVEMALSAPDQLSGRYYTDRGTAGDMTFTRRSENPDDPA